jgi:hypothetical protein
LLFQWEEPVETVGRSAWNVAADPNKKSPARWTLILSIHLRYKSSSLDHPSNQRTEGDAYGECRYNCLDRMSLQALCCVVDELFSGVAALLGDPPHRSNAVLKCIGNRGCCLRRLARCSGNLLAGSF